MSEPRRIFETPLGPVEIRGRDTGRPVQVVITGFIARETQFGRAQINQPDLDCWRIFLPGNRCPALATTSVGAFAFAIGHALRAALAGRRAQVVGISVGGLVALGLPQELVDRFVLLDPPFRPNLAWPIVDLGFTAHPDHKSFLWGVFGVWRVANETRDYLGLLDRLERPAIVCVGSEALEPRRALGEWPSLVDSVSLARLEAHPLVKIERFDGCGHYLQKDPKRLLPILRRTVPAVSSVS